MFSQPQYERDQSKKLISLAKNGDIRSVEALLAESGIVVDYNAVDRSGRTALHHACSLGHMVRPHILALENG